MLKKRKYLQIAFNGSLPDIEKMINALPISDRILIEAGTPLIKTYGKEGIIAIKNWWDFKIGKNGYVIADLKCMDRGLNEVEIAASAGASAATCLGLSPIETINKFIKKCKDLKIDSMVDMINVRFPFEILQKLKKLPSMVVLHRAADENDKEKQIPHNQINQIKEAYNILISIAGGETAKEIRRAIFNDADIAVVWRPFYENPKETAILAKKFLKEIR